MKELSHMERVNLREVWQNEAKNFTPWLAQESNLALLGDTLKLNLSLEGTELSVGPFRADILCKETYLDKLVLIENQLELTDHTHLGQILTYAAGLKASIVIWVCQKFTEEHRAALDWLNENTSNDMHFFGVEIEIWKIGDSLPAPKFNIVSQPNEWTGWINQAVKIFKTGTLTETQELYLNYWTEFTAAANGLKGLKPSSPDTTNALRFLIGKSNAIFATKVDMREKFIGVELYFSGLDAKERFFRLSKDKDAIEREIGTKLDWQELPQNMATRILLKHEGIDICRRDQWKDQHGQLYASLRSFQKVFLPIILSNDFK